MSHPVCCISMFIPSSSHLSHSLEEEEEEEEDIFFCSSSKTNFHVRKKKWNISKRKIQV